MVDTNSCCIFVEIITNPQMEVADLQALARVAHAHKIPLVADTTTIPFTMFSAKDLGVDIEVVSSTKYISGGATSLGGLIIDYGTEYTKAFTPTIKSELVVQFRCVYDSAGCFPSDHGPGDPRCPLSGAVG